MTTLLGTHMTMRWCAVGSLRYQWHQLAVWFSCSSCVWLCSALLAAAAVPQQLAHPVLVTQVPNHTATTADTLNQMTLDCVNRGRLVLLRRDGTRELLTHNFHSACDPCVSFDGKRLLFAGKRAATDQWNVFEMHVDGTGLRQITQGHGNCRQPCYQSTLYTIVSTEPWYQLTFVSDAAQWCDPSTSHLTWHLYSCKLDGTNVQQVTFNVPGDTDPFMMADGRVLYSSWQRRSLQFGAAGRTRLFAVNIDGTDDALFGDPTGKRFQRMPCITARGTVVFIESNRLTADGGGQVGAVSFRRPLRTYRAVTQPDDGTFRAPAPWVGDTVLIARRPGGTGGNYELGILDPKSGTFQRLYDDPAFDEIQARAVRATPLPDGRSSVVNTQDPNGTLYCLNIQISDLPNHDQLPPGQTRRLRVLEGVPPTDRAGVIGIDRQAAPRAVADAGASHSTMIPRRLLGEIDIEADGSLNIDVPANIPIELQTLDENGMALHSCGWIWARNRERRGCIGCHEDGEMTPDNVFVQAVRRPSMQLTLPAARRRTVDFRRDVMPVLVGKCVSCHDESGVPPRLDGAERAYRSLLSQAAGVPRGVPGGKYVTPGAARTSPVIWHVFGRNTSRPWDGALRMQAAKHIPPGTPPVSEDERRTLVEWIDMGAVLDGIPDQDDGTGQPES